jgi:peptide subunit release factor 1 (eRF1)
MMEDKTITVTCPKCGIKITNTASWFKKPGNNCPGCQLRLATERFKKAIENAENLA